MEALTRNWIVLLAGAALAAGGGYYYLSAGPSVRGLARPLGSDDEDARSHAAKKLAKAGVEAKDAAPELGTALADADAKVRYFAAKALAGVAPGDDEAIDALTKALGDGGPQIRYFAARALRQVHPGAKRAFEALRYATRDADPKVREAAADSLRHVPTVASLANQLADADANVRRHTVKILARVGKAALPAVPALITALRENAGGFGMAVAAAWKTQLAGKECDDPKPSGHVRRGISPSLLH